MTEHFSLNTGNLSCNILFQFLELMWILFTHDFVWCISQIVAWDQVSQVARFQSASHQPHQIPPAVRHQEAFCVGV